jgi:hypothetical protein
VPFPKASTSLFVLAKNSCRLSWYTPWWHDIKLSMWKKILQKIDANIWDGLALRFLRGHYKTQMDRKLFAELERKWDIIRWSLFIHWQCFSLKHFWTFWTMDWLNKYIFNTYVMVTMISLVSSLGTFICFLSSFCCKHIAQNKFACWTARANTKWILRIYTKQDRRCNLPGRLEPLTR